MRSFTIVPLAVYSCCCVYTGVVVYVVVIEFTTTDAAECGDLARAKRQAAAEMGSHGAGHLPQWLDLLRIATPCAAQGSTLCHPWQLGSFRAREEVQVRVHYESSPLLCSSTNGLIEAALLCSSTNGLIEAAPC